MGLRPITHTLEVSLDKINLSEYNYTIMDQIRVEAIVNLVLERKVPTQDIDDAIQKLINISEGDRQE